MKEEELKNRIRKNYFSAFDAESELGNIDFAVAERQPDESVLSRERHWFLWAESKKGTKASLMESFVQLILTIGKERTYEKELAPSYLGAFDAEKFAFLPYNKVMSVFSKNDFNWNVTPSNHSTKEFKELLGLIQSTIGKDLVVFNYSTEEKEFQRFISTNFVRGRIGSHGIPITKNNFVSIYLRWRKEVMPTIALNWKMVNAAHLYESDFFLADLMSVNNATIKDKLYVLLQNDKYRINKAIDPSGLWHDEYAVFRKNDISKHRAFWNKYQRPPKEEYQQYMLDRRDLLVPQDIRERKGSYFTPRIWVEKSQEYIASVLGENWQNEYYIWDCCGGTANLEFGLTEPSHIWVSTIDEADVRVTIERIANQTLPSLMTSHVFQFDFLNDDFVSLPKELLHIIKTPSLRKKLVIYINPPYAEAADKKTVTGRGQNKTDVAVQTRVYHNYVERIGLAGRELAAQFLIRIQQEIPDCILCHFSTPKLLTSPNFARFRQVFKGELKRLFMVPANTFDNVKGQFPICFYIWDLSKDLPYSKVSADVFNADGSEGGIKEISEETQGKAKVKTINDWIITTRGRGQETNIGFMYAAGCDFQHINYNYIVNTKDQLPHPRGTQITDKNFLEIAVYIAVRHCISANWLNNRDQFYYPSEHWEKDTEFQLDCIAYTLFCNCNFISANGGANCWIPFLEQEVGARHAFSCHFMIDYLSGKVIIGEKTIISKNGAEIQPIMSPVFTPSPEAKAVMDAGRELWRYYHSMPDAMPDASLYDIREYFQGRNEENGKMNNSSEDYDYNERIDVLRAAEKILGDKIAEKVYEYGFLIR